MRRFVRRCKEESIQLEREPDGKSIIKLYLESHPVAVESMNEHWSFLGHGIAGLVNIFSPQKIVIGGGISEAGDFYIARIEQEVALYSIADCRVNTKICAAMLGNKAGTMGAARMAFLLSKNKK